MQGVGRGMQAELVCVQGSSAAGASAFWERVSSVEARMWKREGAELFLGWQDLEKD